jgi:hypothetical protein
MRVRNKQAMLNGFDKFAARMAKRYDEVKDCLKANRFEEAQMLLSEIATSHARTSLSLRNVLVRNGVLEENR